jgi:hypothetical protein
MARIAMECKCGWKFFIAGSTQGWEQPCPNCGLAVRIPGRKVGDKTFATAGALAAEKEKGWKMARLAIGLGLVLVVGVLLLIVFMSGGSPAPQDYSSGPITDVQRSTGSALRRDSNMPPPPPPPPPTDADLPKPPSAPKVDTAALRQNVRQTTWMINIAGVVAETLRLRGMAEDRDRMTARAADWDNKLRATVARVEEAGERAQVEDYIRPGDTIVGFAQKDFGTLTAATAADLMAQWLNTFRPNSMEQVILSRGNQRVVVYVDIPEVSKELLELARTPTGDLGKGVSAPAAPGGTPAPPSTSVFAGTLPDDVLKSIESGFANLPPGYRQLLPALDRNRMDPLLQSKKGTEDDLAFLRNRILGQALPAYEKEVVLVKSKVSELEAKLKSTTAVDVIHFKDGRKVEGQILEDTEAHVKIKARLGTITVPKADVLRVERGKGAGLEFPDKLKAAGGKLEGLVSLLGWCKEKNLKLEGDYVAYQILAMDPANEAARAFAGLKRPI